MASSVSPSHDLPTTPSFAPLAGVPDDMEVFCAFDWGHVIVPSEVYGGGSKTAIRLWAHNRNSDMCLLRIEDYRPYYWLQAPTHYEGVAGSADAAANELPPPMMMPDGRPYIRGQLIDPKPRGFPIKWSQERLQQFYRAVNSHLGGNKARPPQSAGYTIEGGDVQSRRTHYDWIRGEKWVAKVRWNSHYGMTDAKNRLADAFPAPWDPTKMVKAQLHETSNNLNAVRKLTAERGLGYADWLRAKVKEVPAGSRNRISSCKHEYIVSWQDLHPVTQEEAHSNGWEVHPRLMAFDIECTSDSPGIFPNEYRDSNEAFMISCAYQEGGRPHTLRKYCIVMGDVRDRAIEAGTVIIRVNDELSLVKEYCRLVHEMDVDVMIGHNTLRFDWKYLNQRLRRLGEKWPSCGSRLLGEAPEFVDESWSSSNAKSVVIKYLNFHGRINVDTYTMAVSNVAMRLPNYKLETVAQAYIKKGKVDVSPAELINGYNEYREARDLMRKVVEPLSEGEDPATTPPRKHPNVTDAVWVEVTSRYLRSVLEMERLTVYCIQDSALCIELFEAVSAWIDIEETARVANICRKYAYTKGQSFRAISSIYKMNYDKNIIMDDPWEAPIDYRFEGALNMGTALRNDGVELALIYLDVNSMYPNIVIKGNVCGQTRPMPDLEEQLVREGKATYESWLEKNTGFYVSACFLKTEIHEGVTPRRCRLLLDERIKVRAIMNKTTDKKTLTMLDKKQNALKVQANSIYGVLKGRSREPGGKANPNEGTVCCPTGSRYVTKKGRDTLLAIKDFLEVGPGRLINVDPVTMAPKGVRVFYGDTDSLIFAAKGVTDPAECAVLAAVYTDAINKHIAPLAVKVEGLIDMLLLTAKRYAQSALKPKLSKEDYEEINVWKAAMLDYLFLPPDEQAKAARPPIPDTLPPHSKRDSDYSSLKYTGVQPVKRNQPPVLKTIFMQVCKLALSRDLMHSPMERAQRIVDAVHVNIHAMLSKSLPVKEYSMATNYVSDCNSDVSKFASMSALRGKPLQKGEWFSFVIVKVPGAPESLPKANRMRFVDEVSIQEPIDHLWYVKYLAKSIDMLLAKVYNTREEYEVEEVNENGEVVKTTILATGMQRFLIERGTPRIMAELLGTGVSSEAAYLERIEEMVNTKGMQVKGSAKPKERVDLPRSMVEYYDYRSDLHKNDKSRITTAITALNKTGGALAVPSTNLVTNILTAYSLGMLDQYTEASVSPEALIQIRGLYGL